MRKLLIFALLIVVIAAFPVLSACSSEETAAPATSAAPAATSAAEPLVFKFASENPEVADASQFAAHFMDYVEERANGEVVFERYYGGVLGTGAEMLDFLSSGAVQMTNLLGALFKDVMPLHNYPHWQMGSGDKAMYYTQQMEFDNPETAAIMEQECKDNNIIILNYHDLGENGIIAREMFSSLSDLSGKKLGSNMSQKALETMGLNIMSISVPDMYESLSRGVVDCTTMPLAPIIANKWYDVCSCFAWGGYYASGQQNTFSLDAWNSLSDEMKALFWEAAADTVEFSIGFTAEVRAKHEQILKDSGVTIIALPEEEVVELFRLNYNFQMEEMVECAERAGKSAEAAIVQAYADELTWGE